MILLSKKEEATIKKRDEEIGRLQAEMEGKLQVDSLI